MKIKFHVWHIFVDCSKVLGLCGIFLLILLSSCKSPLDTPANLVSQADLAIAGQKRAMSQMKSFTKEEIIAKKRDVSELLNTAEPFLARKVELEKTELVLTQDHLNKSQTALRFYLGERTSPGLETITSEMSKAMSQASESISSAEQELSRFKNKQPESNN